MAFLVLKVYESGLRARWRGEGRSGWRVRESPSTTRLPLSPRDISLGSEALGLASAFSEGQFPAGLLSPLDRP